MHKKIKDNMRERLIEGLLLFMDEAETKEERKIYSDSATMLINSRTPEQVNQMEIEKFGQSMGQQ